MALVDSKQRRRGGRLWLLLGPDRRSGMEQQQVSRIFLRPSLWESAGKAECRAVHRLLGYHGSAWHTNSSATTNPCTAAHTGATAHSGADTGADAGADASAGAMQASN